MKLAAVVVFYRPKNENIHYIDKYLKSVDKLYIVDNTEDDLIRINKDTNKIQYIKLYENKGVAFALNEGARHAIKDGYKYLLTMDQDSKVTSQIIDNMKKFIRENDMDKIGIVSPYHDIKTDDPKKGEVEERIEVMTSGNIVNLDIYKKIGGFKDWLFIDCVDTEYCMNLNKNGYKVIRLNDVIMKHELGNLKIHKLFGNEYPCYNHNPIRRYYMVRNALYLNDMYKDVFPDYCAWLIRVQKGQVKRIILFENDKIKKLLKMLKGYQDYKKGVKGKIK